MVSRAHIAGAAGIALFGTAVFLVFPHPFARSSQTDAAPSVQIARADSAHPIRLIIPVIRVDAAIEPIGLTPTGAMGAPKNPADVAWFTLGPRPGEIGSAVVDGHFGWKDNLPAVFDNLYTLHKGDRITVEDTDGMSSTFVVRELRTYGSNENASDVFSSSDGKAHLNLITCEGVWDSVSKSYSKRLVVFADKE